jgi:uncharacterized integral membrane protein
VLDMASRHETPAPRTPDGPTIDTGDPTPPSPATGQRTETVRDYRGAGIMWTGVALVAAVAVFVIITLQNMQDVEFDFLWFDVVTPLSLILAITFALALILGEVIGFVWRHRRRNRLRERDELRRLRGSSR